jgi:hypothetical protein
MATHQRQPYSGTERKLVIAIDVGTTFSGVSYALLDPGIVPQVQPVTQYVMVVQCLSQNSNLLLGLLAKANHEVIQKSHLQNIPRVVRWLCTWFEKTMHGDAWFSLTMLYHGVRLIKIA